MKRLFCAIKIHPDEAFTMAYNNLKKALGHERIKWVDLSNVHITLKFFGETQEDLIPVIIASLDDAVFKFKPFQLTLKKTGIFGSSYAPRVIWFGIEDQGVLALLYKSIHENLLKTGFSTDRQNFVPHLTIARINEIKNKTLFQKAINAYKEGTFGIESVTQLHLFESKLHSTGPEYTALHSFDFQDK